MKFTRTVTITQVYREIRLARPERCPECGCDLSVQAEVVTEKNGRKRLPEDPGVKRGDQK
jgi:hypothetical protein